MWHSPFRTGRGDFGHFIVVNQDIYNSNFRCFDGLRRRCHLYLVIGLELSFNLVPCTSHGTSWKPSYEPSKFANFVWDLYGIASNSRKKTCQIYFPIQNTSDHVTVCYNALQSYPMRRANCGGTQRLMELNVAGLPPIRI